MITYEYECKLCEYFFEKRQSINDRPIKKCPKCNRNSLLRIISGGMHGFVKGTKTPKKISSDLCRITEKKEFNFGSRKFKTKSRNKNTKYAKNRKKRKG